MKTKKKMNNFKNELKYIICIIFEKNRKFPRNLIKRRNYQIICFLYNNLFFLIYNFEVS